MNKHRKPIDEQSNTDPSKGKMGMQHRPKQK
jgi:hypothetical protein